MRVFTDRIDYNTKISLYEYKIIRNPKTDKCVICTNTYELDTSFGDMMDDSPKPKVRVEYISFDDVHEALEDVDDGYFDFIGSTRKKELELLDNDYLTQHIFSINQYDGYFELNR
jgi:hypothetical protein